MDELKKHIIQHADEMDFDVPDAELWSRIETELEPPVRKLPVVRIIRFAAAACFILAAGTGIWFFMNDKEEKQPVAVVKEEKTVEPKKEVIDTNKEQVQIIPEERIIEEPKQIAAVTKPIKKERIEVTADKPKAIKDPAVQFATAVNEMSASFMNVVNLQRKELSKTPIYGESADYYSDFKAQFYRLDQEEKDLKKQMTKTGPADNSLQRLIDIYQQKINILKQLQNEINKTNSRYKLSRPDDKSVSKQFINI